MSGIEAGLAEKKPSLTHEEAFARIRLLRSPNIGPVSYRQLLVRFGNAVSALEALPELSARGGRRYEAAPEQRVRVPYSGGPNAGMIDFDMRGERPSLRFNVIDARGRAVWEPFVLHADELANGRRSWPDKTNADLLPA